jgi:hypothetical protein
MKVYGKGHALKTKELAPLKKDKSKAAPFGAVLLAMVLIRGVNRLANGEANSDLFSRCVYKLHVLGIVDKSTLDNASGHFANTEDAVIF